MRPMKIRLGEMLVSQGLLRDSELPDYLAKAKQTGKKLGRVLVDAKRVTETVLVQALANQLGLPFIDLQKITINQHSAQLLPETMARRWGCLVVSRDDKPNGLAEFTVAMSDPADVFAYDEISKVLHGELVVVAATEEGIFSAIDRLYRKNDEIVELAEALTREFTDAGSGALDLAQLGTTAGDDAPVVKLLQSIFEDAIARRASDIHIEPMERKLLVRIRVDGTLHILNEADPKTAAPLAQRLKLISGLNISERRLPQDGRFNVKVHRHLIDVRIATSPSAFGESVVMRLLNQNAAHFDLDQLNMPPETKAAFLQAIDRPQGMILVTGPTGSGKTTTLYSALTRLNTSELKLITVEDPVEYQIPGINQIQIHEKIGLTFNTSLRALLRQDPDVILVGEMRDKETVDAALRASMTGHLVLSTLHTNDAKSAAARLVDMGAEPFIVGQSLHLVLAQRLVRLICTRCAVPHRPNDHELAWSDQLAREGVSPDSSEVTFRIGQGCEQCSHTGYLGRIAIYEHLNVNREMIAALAEGLQRFSEAAARFVHGKTLSHHANALARKGSITLKEARRVSYEA